MILAGLVILLVLITLFTGIQTLYLEGMRLRTRDLPALAFFKEEIEDRLKLKSEEAALTFSVWKHTCLVLFGVLALAQVIDGGRMSGMVLVQGIALAWAFMMFCGYLVPQILYRRTSGHWIRPLVPFYSAAALVVRPLVAALAFLQRLLEVVKQEPEGEEQTATAAENIEALIDAGTEEGLIQEDDRRLIQSVVAFGDKIVREVMTPRPNIVGIQAESNLEALHSLVVNEQYSRIPVYGESIDDVLGFVHVRDMFEIPESDRQTRTVRQLMRPVRFVPETKSAHDIMREMQQDGSHMVVVIDEYGNTAGLATLEDLVEVILGEIRDEHEPTSDVAEDGNGGYIVSGNFDIARVPEILSAFHPGDDIESSTIGGLIMEWLGRVPRPGEAIERDGLRVEVLASDEMRVEQVRLSKTQTQAIEA
jgi:CBS domain containing-hemolysin-like protein